MCTLDQSLLERYAEELIRREVALERAQDPRALKIKLLTVDEKRRRL